MLLEWRAVGRVDQCARGSGDSTATALPPGASSFGVWDVTKFITTHALGIISHSKTLGAAATISLGAWQPYPFIFFGRLRACPRCSPRTIEQLENQYQPGAEACANLQALVVPRLQAAQRRVADAAMRPCRPRRLAHPQPTHRARRPRRELRQRAAAPAAAALAARRRLQVAAASLAACCSSSRRSTSTAAISRSDTSIGSCLHFDLLGLTYPKLPFQYASCDLLSIIERQVLECVDVELCLSRARRVQAPAPSAARGCTPTTTLRRNPSPRRYRSC